MTDKKIALITGVTGQDGSLLADLLLEKGYEVFGLRRRLSSDNLNNANHLKGKIKFVDGDITDLSSLIKIIRDVKPHEMYHLAAQSHVKVSFDEPIHTGLVTGMGVLNCLEAIRQSGEQVKFVQAGSSEMFGGVLGEVMMNEETPFHPRSPYGCAKVFGHNIVTNYRESYGMFACNAISFNHESCRRGINFVTRKVTRAIADIKAERIESIGMGNLDAKRDWSHAKDVVRGMWMMLQADKPDDFVFASGRTHSVRHFCEVAFEHAGLGDYQDYIYIDPQFYRPAEVDVLLGDSEKAKRELGWEPEFTFEDLVKEMVEFDLNNPDLDVK